MFWFLAEGKVACKAAAKQSLNIWKHSCLENSSSKISLKCITSLKAFWCCFRMRRAAASVVPTPQIVTQSNNLFYGSFYLAFSPALLNGVFSVHCLRSCNWCLQQRKSTTRGNIFVFWLQIFVQGRMLPVEPPLLMQKSRPCSRWSEKCCPLLVTSLARGWLLEKAKLPGTGAPHSTLAALPLNVTQSGIPSRPTDAEGNKGLWWVN